MAMRKIGMVTGTMRLLQSFVTVDLPRGLSRWSGEGDDGLCRWMMVEGGTIQLCMLGG